MNVCVVGLWHLGTVTAACLAAGGHTVCGLDFDDSTIAALARGKAPLFEPGLDDLLRAGLDSGRLRFSADARDAVSGADLVWVTYDTPVDDDDRADVEYVSARVRRLFPHLASGTFVLTSSQVPVGTSAMWAREFGSHANGRRVGFGYSPENLRLGKAIDVFSHPDRVVVGVPADADRQRIIELLRPFTERIEWMSVESAEMTKHALNAFLATSVTFINEIAAICEQVGADAGEVERGLKSEARIGPKAYLSPGGAFAGGTLARDIVFLSQLGQQRGLATHLLTAVKASNDAHRAWAQRRLHELIGDLAGKTVAVWGLTYKPGTDTLRRSSAVELCHWLHRQHAVVRAYDPAVRTLPPDLHGIVTLGADALDAVRGAEALVVATSWPAFRELEAEQVAAVMARPLVLDANRSLGEAWARVAQYVSVGKGI